MSSPLSRRALLRSAAAVAVTASVRPIWSQQQRPTILYVGSYTARGAGIYRYRVNPDTGELTLLNVAGDQMNPSFVAISPDQRFLYAVNEIGNYEGRQTGSVTAFAINQATGELTMLNRQPTEGRNPAHISIDPTGRFALVANYSGGNVTVLPIQADGRLATPSDVVDHTGELGPNRQRQEAPHAHMILPDPTGRYILANDLGLDKTFIYRLDHGAGTLSLSDPEFATAAPGGGPRHLAFHPNGRFVFVLNELNSTLTSFQWDAMRGLMQPVQTISTLPENYVGINTTAHVVVSPSGRFVYASNRGHNSIAAFRVDPETGRLEFVERVWTMGETPRNFAIDPTGNFMYVGHQTTDNIVVFRVNQQTGRLTPTGQFISAGQPVSFAFLAPPAMGSSTREGVTFWAHPNPIPVTDGSAVGVTTLSWHAPGAESAEIRVNAPNGPLFSRGVYGSATTGRWVLDGMTFYLQDVSGGRALTPENTLGTVRAALRMY